MTSEIRVDKIHNEGGDNDSGIDLSTNDQIVLKTANTTRLTMNATGQTTIVGEGGSTTTNLQGGLAKAWLQAADSASVRDSINIASGTDDGTGQYTYAFTNSFSNDDYAPTVTTVVAEVSATGNVLTSAFDIFTFLRTDSFAYEDQVNYASVHGDLA